MVSSGEKICAVKEYVNKKNPVLFRFDFSTKKTMDETKIILTPNEAKLAQKIEKMVDKCKWTKSKTKWVYKRENGRLHCLGQDTQLKMSWKRMEKALDKIGRAHV